MYWGLLGLEITRSLTLWEMVGCMLLYFGLIQIDSLVTADKNNERGSIHQILDMTTKIVHEWLEYEKVRLKDNASSL